jgi:antitoxin (DNA-binding transcriptional repressor) of toxin-antitoxin stability system
MVSQWMVLGWTLQSLVPRLDAPRLPPAVTPMVMQSKRVTVKYAKANLSALIDRAAAGEEIVLMRDGNPLAKLVCFERPKRKLVFGRLKGKVRVAADFDAPLPPSLLAAFEG